ncbi:MAG: SMP-30/gluconolactonase/LRE family protein [Rhizomicrobium sp.]
MAKNCRRRTIWCSTQNGGFWFTDHGSTNDKHRTHGALYYAKADGSKITKVLRELLSPNGVGMSPDYKTVHYAETFPARLWSLSLTAPGVGASPAGFTPANFEGGYPGLAYFDSLGVQADGGVCVATILAGGISTFWPHDKKFEHTPLPDLLVTNICWGGKDMETAFITMSSTGKLATMKWRSPGLRLAPQRVTVAVRYSNTIFGAARTGALSVFCDFVCNGEISLPLCAVWRCRRHRRTGIGQFADRPHKWHLTQERRTHTARRLPRAAWPKI